MNGLLIKMLAVGSLLAGSMSAAAATVPTVVPGRTWWYTSVGIDRTGEPYSAVWGLKLGDSEERDADGWVPCYAVDRYSGKLFEASLGKIRDEGSQVWLMPNLNLEEEVPASALEERGARLVRTFLGYWYGRELIPWFWTDMVWTDKPADTPYLLYDYGYTVGDKYEWPWSGIGIASEEVWWWDSTNQRGFFINGVSEPIGPDGVARKEFELGQLPDEEALRELAPDPWGTAKIVEGIGMVDGHLLEYLPDVNLCSGFWIAPASLGNVLYTGIYVPPTHPDLECVRDADGTCVYGDPEFDPETYDYRPWEEDSVEELESSADKSEVVYDLQGRKVTNPESGLYVRGEKKVVVRR